MAIAKRKGVAKSAGQLAKRSRWGVKKERVEEEDEDVQEEAADNDEEEAEGEEQEQENEEESLARREAEITAARKKELKAMPVGELKDLLASKGLETGKKEDMVEALVAHEAELRERERAHQAKIRDVLVKKKEELEALSIPELRVLCNAAGATGILTKQVRVQLLMKQWQEDDGVDKALAKMARDAREEELVSMDKAALRKLCAKKGVDAFVKEVMVDRIVRHEVAAGRFARPKLEEEEEETSQAASKPGKGGDMVDALLANEANRKKEKEQKKQEEDAAASKRKELRAMPMDELKKLLTSKGQEATGKKEELVEALFAISVQEDAVAARRAKLKTLGLDELKERLKKKGLEVGKKDAMVDTLLAHEAKIRDEVGAWDAKISEVLEKKKEELEENTAADLKELCASKGLKLGLGKQDRVETLLQDVKASGGVDAAIVAMAREARKVELLGMDKDAVLKLCEAAGADPLVKEVMVERVLAYEDECGSTGAEGEAKDDEDGGEKKRPAKRVKTSKK